MNIQFEMVVYSNPVISMIAMMERGYRFEAVDMPKTECMYDREGEERDKGPDAE